MMWIQNGYGHNFLILIAEILNEQRRRVDNIRIEKSRWVEEIRLRIFPPILICGTAIDEIEK